MSEPLSFEELDKRFLGRNVYVYYGDAEGSDGSPASTHGKVLKISFKDRFVLIKTSGGHFAAFFNGLYLSGEL